MKLNKMRPTGLPLPLELPDEDDDDGPLEKLDNGFDRCNGQFYDANINTKNCSATNGKVALISNNPPGPLTSELEITIERLIIQNLYILL